MQGEIIAGIVGTVVGGIILAILGHLYGKRMGVYDRLHPVVNWFNARPWAIAGAFSFAAIILSLGSAFGLSSVLYKAPFIKVEVDTINKDKPVSGFVMNDREHDKVCLLSKIVKAGGSEGEGTAAGSIEIHERDDRWEASQSRVQTQSAA